MAMKRGWYDRTWQALQTEIGTEGRHGAALKSPAPGTMADVIVNHAGNASGTNHGG
ncbi:MAG: hypothetical protein QGF47_06735 [Arenicellales bacterium]|nr:hypothetical protein [Arenicellales bacterium]